MSQVSYQIRSMQYAARDNASHRGKPRTDTAVFAADEPAGYTLALDVGTVIPGRVGVVPDIDPGRAVAQPAVEALDLRSPELEVARRGILVAAEGDLWWAVREPGNPPFSGCWP